MQNLHKYESKLHRYLTKVLKFCKLCTMSKTMGRNQASEENLKRLLATIFEELKLETFSCPSFDHINNHLSNFVIHLNPNSPKWGLHDVQFLFIHLWKINVSSLRMNDDLFYDSNFRKSCLIPSSGRLCL